MPFKSSPYLKDFSLTILSSFLLTLSFPNFDLGLLAWVGLLPFLIALPGKSLRYGFFLSFVCGVLFFAGIFHWILEIPKYTLLHHALLGLYLGPYFGFFGLSFNFISTRWGVTPAFFAAPFIWVSLEYIRSNLSFLALPLGLLAYSQYQYPSVIQIASVTGTYGISFLIVLVNSALAAVTYSYLCPFLGDPAYRLSDSRQVRSPLRHAAEQLHSYRPPSNKGGIILMVAAAPLTVLALIYGHVIVSQPIVGERIKISVVQGNIEQANKWDPRYAREIMQTYSGLTQEASKNRPVLIIWPETATPGAINEDIRLHMEVKNIAKKAGTYLLLGSAQYQKFEEKGARKLKYLNSAYLIHPNPKTMKSQRYDKIHLFPFGEYLPLKGIVPWSYLNVTDVSEYMPGKELTVFQIPGFRFGVTICWENLFPDLFRQFVRRGAQFMVNITNEAHFGKTAAPRHLVSISVFRAVENRIVVVRCANTGVSCIIEPYGRIVDRVKDQQGQDIFIRGVISGWVIPLESKTIYTRHGDWFVWVAIFGSVVFLSVSSLRTRGKKFIKNKTRI